MNSPISTLLLAIAVPVSMAHGQEIKSAERILVQPKEAPALDTTLPISKTPIICVDNLSESELASTERNSPLDLAFGAISFLFS